MEFTTLPAGTPCWIDIATTDLDAAKAFYTAVFGWTYLDMPTPQGPYSLAQLDGVNVCGLTTMMPDMIKAGVPPHWNSYIASDDVDADTDKAAELGATVVLPPFDMEAGRMSIVTEPGGATFIIFKDNGEMDTPTRCNEPDTWCWNELYTKDLDKSEAFYTELFGWTAKRGENSAGAEMSSFSNGDRQIANVIVLTPDMGPMPPMWNVYFAVADIDGWIEKAQAAGAKVFFPPMAIPEVGRFTMLMDPQGTGFSVVQLEMESA